MSDLDLISRRDFGSLCAILAASLASCSGLTSRTRTAAAFVVDPPLTDYSAILHALIETVLPIGEPDFPLDARTVHDRLLRMFPLEEESRFLGLQRTLVYFNDLDLAPHVAAPLIAAERLALDVPARLTEREFRRVAAKKIAFDEALARRFADTTGTFTALPPQRRRQWLYAWRDSAFTVKREFAQSIRGLINVSTYSADAMWPVIHYAGPLVHR